MIELREMTGDGTQSRKRANERNRYNAFSWWSIMNIPTREPTPVRGVSHGWRVLLLDFIP